MKKLNKILIGLFVSIILSTGVAYALTTGNLDSNFTPNRAGVPYTLEQSCNNNNDCSNGFACSQISHRCTHPGFAYTTFNNFINNDRIPGTEAWDQDERKFLAGAYCGSSDTCNLATDTPATKPSVGIYNKIPHTADTIKIGDKVFFWIYFHNNGQSGNNGVTATNIDIGMKDINIGQTENGIFTLKPTGYIDSTQTSEITDNMGVKLEQQNVKLVPQPKAFIVTRPDGQSESKTWTSIEPGQVKDVKLHKNGNSFVTTSTTFSSNQTGMSVHLATLPGCFEYSGFVLFSAVVEELPATCGIIHVTKDKQVIHTNEVVEFSATANRPNTEGGGTFSGNIKYSVPQNYNGFFYTSLANANSNTGGVKEKIVSQGTKVYFKGTATGTDKIKVETIGTNFPACSQTFSIEEAPATCGIINVTKDKQVIHTNEVVEFSATANRPNSEGGGTFNGNIKYSVPQNYNGFFYTSLANANSNTGGVKEKIVPQGTKVYFKGTATGTDKIKVETIGTNVPACTKTFSIAETLCEQLYVLHNSTILSDTTSSFKSVAYDTADIKMPNKIKYSLTGGAAGYFYIINPGDPQNPFGLIWDRSLPPGTFYDMGLNIFGAGVNLFNGFIPNGNGPFSFFENVITNTKNFFAYVNDYTKASLFDAVGPQLTASPSIQSGLFADPIGLQHGGLNTDLLNNLLIAGSTSLDNVNPETTVYFIGNGSAGQVKVETKDVTGVPLCNNQFPIVPPVCKNIIVTSNPQVPATHDITAGTKVAFTAKSTWGPSGDNSHPFDSKKSNTITYTVNPANGYIYKGTVDPGGTYPNSITVNPEDTVTFQALTAGNNALTIKDNSATAGTCIQTYSVSAQELNSCDAFAPTVGASTSSNPLSTGKMYEIIQHTTYHGTVNPKQTKYTVLNGLGSLNDSNGIPYPLDANHSITLDNSTLVYFGTTEATNLLSDGETKDALKMEDVAYPLNCNKLYQVHKENEVTNQCYDLTITKPSGTWDSSDFDPNGNQKFETNLVADNENSYTYTWSVTPSSATNGWANGPSYQGTNILLAIDASKNIKVTVTASSPDDSCSATISLNPTPSGPTIEKSVQEVLNGANNWVKYIIIGDTTSEVKYRVTINTKDENTVRFQETKFDSSGRLKGTYPSGSTTSIQNGYLIFKNVDNIFNGSKVLSKCQHGPQVPCYVTSDLNGDFKSNNPITLKNLSAPTVTIEYTLTNKSVVTSNSCTQILADNGCGETFNNTIKLLGTSSYSSQSSSATVIALCPYIITRGSGDVFFHEEPNVGSNLTCANLQNSLGIIIKPIKHPDTTPNTGIGQYTEERNLAVATHDVCKQQTGIKEYDNSVAPNFSSSICKMESDVSKVWQEPYINKTIVDNAIKIGRWKIENGGDINAIKQKMSAQGVIVINGDLTIPTSGFEVKGETNIPAAQTYIIKGNLIIKGDIKYNDASLVVTNPKTIPSVAFVVINGDITINQNVKTLDGIYVALSDKANPTKGQIKSDGTVTTNNLTVRGSLVGDVSNLFLNRRGLGNPYKDEGAIAINYDERLILNTPPGLSNFLDIAQMKIPHKTN